MDSEAISWGATSIINHPSTIFTNIKYDSPGTMVGRAHLLDDVIDNIENIGKHYYQKRTLSFVLKDTHSLTKQFKENNTNSNGSQQQHFV